MLEQSLISLYQRGLQRQKVSLFLWLNAVCVCVLDLSYPPGISTIPGAQAF